MTSPNGSINKCQVYRFNSNSLSKFLFLDIVHSSKHRLIHVSLYHKRRCFCSALRIYTYKTLTFLYKMANTILLSKKEIAYIIGSNIPSSILEEKNILCSFWEKISELNILIWLVYSIISTCKLSDNALLYMHSKEFDNS